MSRPSRASEPDTFRLEWGYLNEVAKSISGAARFEVHPVPGCYKSGRPRFEAVFLTSDAKRVVAKREAMSLTSKKTGQPYHVCRRHEDWRAAKAAATLRVLEEAGFSVDDALPAN